METADVKGEDAGEGCTDDTLKRLEQTYLRDLKLQGVENIRKVRPSVLVNPFWAPCIHHTASPHCYRFSSARPSAPV